MSTPGVETAGTSAPDENVIKILESPNMDKSSRTFIIKGEDHTLGWCSGTRSNPLQFVISKYPEVQFCACTPTHPLEDQMMLRVQCKPGNDAQAVFARGLDDVATMYSGLKNKYVKAKNKCLAQQDAES